MNNEPARWDATVEGLLAYAEGVRYDALSPAVVSQRASSTILRRPRLPWRMLICEDGRLNH